MSRNLSTLKDSYTGLVTKETYRRRISLLGNVKPFFILYGLNALRKEVIKNFLQKEGGVFFYRSLPHIPISYASWFLLPVHNYSTTVY